MEKIKENILQHIQNHVSHDGKCTRCEKKDAELVKMCDANKTYAESMERYKRITYFYSKQLYTV